MSEHQDLIKVLDRIAIALEILAGRPKPETEKYSLLVGEKISMQDLKYLLSNMLTLGKFSSTGEIHSNLIDNGYRVNLNTLRKTLRDYFVFDENKGWCIK